MSALLSSLVVLAVVSASTVSNSVPSSIDSVAHKPQSDAVQNMLMFQDERKTGLVYNYSGSIRYFFPEQAVDLGTFGCCHSTPTEVASCVAEILKSDLVGFSGELKQAGVIYSNGLHYVSFDHYLANIPVFGSRLMIALDADLALSGISNSIVLNTSLVSSANEAVISPEEALLSLPVDNATKAFLVVYVDRSSESTEGRLAITVHHEVPETGTAISVFSADLTELLMHDEGNQFYSSGYKIRSNYSAVEHSVVPCGRSCTHNCQNSECVLLCQNWLPCASIFPDDPYCHFGTLEPELERFCYAPLETAYPPPLTVYDDGAGGWTDAGYAYHYVFNQAFDILERLDNWYESGYGISSYGDESGQMGAEYYVDFLGVKTASASMGGADGLIHIYRAPEKLDSPAIDKEKWALQYRVYAHEFGHKSFYAFGNQGYFVPDCGSEIHAQMHGVLFARNEYPNSADVWGTYNQTAYFDDVYGLTGEGSAYLKYAQRFVYDNLECGSTNDAWVGTACTSDNDCGPYEECRLKSENPDIYECSTGRGYHNNMVTWTRFLRVLEMGSDAFVQNGLGESMGYSFAGLGLAATTEIYASVIRSGSLSSDDSLQDFAQEMMAHASPSQRPTMSYALGAIGVFTYEYTIDSSTYTFEEADSFYWGNWHSSTDKSFYAWIDLVTKDVKLRYHDGASYVTTNWSAYAGSAPVLQAYNNRLYVFWRDASSSSIKMRYIGTTGWVSPLYDLGGLQVKSSGDFSAVVANGDLYLVYTKTGSNDTYISKCSPNGLACSPYSSRWASWNGLYYKGLGVDSLAGLAAIATDNLNESLPLIEFVYIAHANPGSKNICISRFNPATDVIDSINSVCIDESAPSYTTESKIGIDVRRSAYSGTAGNYLYIAWKDEYVPNIYMSVLQSGFSYGINDTWITRPHDTDYQSQTGVQLQGRNNYENGILTQLIYVNGYRPKRTSAYGRY